MLTWNALQRLCNALEAELARQRVEWLENSVSVTPYEIRMKVTARNGHRPDPVTLSEALGVPVQVQAVEEVRADLSGRDGILEARRQPGGFVVTIPRNDTFRVRLSDLLRKLRNVPPATALLGIAADGAPLLLRLPSLEVRHVLVTGPEGCGKSALLRTMALSLRHFSPGLPTVAEVPPDDLARAVRKHRERPVIALYYAPPPLEALSALLECWPLAHVILEAGDPEALGPLADCFPVRIEGLGTPGDFVAYTPEGRYRFWAAWPDDASTLFPLILGNKVDALPAGR